MHLFLQSLRNDSNDWILSASLSSKEAFDVSILLILFEGFSFGCSLDYGDSKEASNSRVLNNIRH